MKVKSGGNCYMFKILDSSFSLKQTGKKETWVETPGSLFKTELLRYSNWKRQKEEEEETHCADSSQRLSRFRDRIKTSAKLLNCNLLIRHRFDQAWQNSGDISLQTLRRNKTVTINASYFKYIESDFRFCIG